MELVESERLGIEAIRPETENIYSVGISSFANAELAVLERHPTVRITSTTIDERGLTSTRAKLDSIGEKRIICKLEDVREPLPHPDSHFDYVYARLALHYLTQEQIKHALKELRRIMKKDAKIYVVVRSINEWELKQEGVTKDKETDMTTYPVTSYETGIQETRTRRFYSVQTLKDTLVEAGFFIDWCEEFQEILYRDFERTQPNPKPNALIAALAEKTKEAEH